MLVKIEVAEDNDGLAFYSGVIDDTEFEQLVSGQLTRLFIKLDQVFWVYTKKGKSEWEEDKKLMVKYGEGVKKNCAGTLYIRADRIRLISPLKAVAMDDGSIAETA